MDIYQAVKQLNLMLEGGDQSCDFGCSLETVEHMIDLSKSLCPSKPYCTIKDWGWVDLDISENSRAIYRKNNLFPCFVRTETIIYDEAKRPHIDTTVRSTALLGFHHNCIFETANTSYILVGTGSRVTINPDIFQYLVER